MAYTLTAFYSEGRVPPPEVKKIFFPCRFFNRRASVVGKVPCVAFSTSIAFSDREVMQEMMQ